MKRGFPYVAQSNGELRLSVLDDTSYTFTSGRLQIYLDGQWGNICDTGFGLTEAVVACQQLTYNTALSFGSSQTDMYVSLYMDVLFNLQEMHGLVSGIYLLLQ